MTSRPTVAFTVDLEPDCPPFLRGFRGVEHGLPALLETLGEMGYDPRAMTGVMQILARSSGAGRQPEFFSTHPNPENRVQRIEEAVAAQFPSGVPAGLEPARRR